MGSSQRGFTKEKSSLTSLTAYHETTSLLDEGTAVDIVYLDSSKALNSLSHKSLIDKLKKRGLDEWTVR